MGDTRKPDVGKVALGGLILSGELAVFFVGSAGLVRHK